jgi:hypothetical protein
MEVIASLIALYCQNHFNYKGCEDFKFMCVEQIVRAERLSQARGDKPQTTKSEIYAKAYMECITLDQNNCLN